MNYKIFEQTLICNSCRGKLEFKTKKRYTYCLCRKCNKEIKSKDEIFIFEEKGLKSLNNKIYDSFWNDVKNADTKSESYFLENKLLNANKDLIKDKIILEAGGGDGRHLKLIAKQKPKCIIYVDISDSIYLAKERWVESGLSIPIIFIKSRIENINFKEKSIDFIWCAGVLTIAENYNSIIYYLLKNANKTIILGLLSKNLFGKVYFALNPLRPFFRKLKKYRMLYFFLIPLCLVKLIFNLIYKLKEFVFKNNNYKKYELNLFKIYSLIQEPFIAPNVNKINTQNLIKLLKNNGYHLKSTTQELLISYMVFVKI